MIRSSLLTSLLVAISTITPTCAQDSLSISSAVVEPIPIQSLYVPLPERALLLEVFQVISSTAANPVTTLVSIAVSTDATIIYYDHWEDGYDSNASNSNRQASTEVWGDGDSSNGCAPTVTNCNNVNDRLNAGDVIVLENEVSTDRGNPTSILYDGGDRIQSNLPVAMTRAAYPKGPGSLLAGAVEVIEEANWGTSFVAPVGEDTAHATSAYQFSAIAVMSGTDGNTVHKNGIMVDTLDQGDSKIVRVNQGDTLTTTGPAQAHLITGDIGSNYELRWYALTPQEDWSNEYYAPVGDTEGKAKVTLYNNGNTPITVTVETTAGTYGVTVPAGREATSEIIPNGTGAKFTSSDGNFFAFSSTDTQRSGTNGQIFDWGYPLMTRDQLTNVALVGLGYGCTGNSCDSTGERSVVWVTPVEAADIYVDFDNDGEVDATYTVGALEGKVLTDDDEDMSGAIIWATQPGTSKSGPGVDIAAAWGQKAALSGSGDGDAMDLGTVIVPFEAVRAECVIELTKDNDNNRVMSEGDEVTQTITVLNAGPAAIGSGSLVVDTLMGPYTIDISEATGGTTVVTIIHTIPPGEIVNESCEVEPYVPSSDAPSVTPTGFPTMSPTSSPSKPPTGTPNAEPSSPPTGTPTGTPTVSTPSPTDATRAPTPAPTHPPTGTPTVSTPAPSDATPTPTPRPKTPPPVLIVKTPAPTPATPPPTPSPIGSSSGDPHFLTWTGGKFDYHGECDLVLVHNPDFAGGKGLRVHIRTTRVKYFSFIEKVAVQIGKDVLEFDNDVETFLINGKPVEENRRYHKTMLSGFVVRRDRKAISVRLDDGGTALERHSGNIAKIDLHTRKNGFPAVIVHAGHSDAFKGSLGLLGEWGTGRKLARDGKKEFDGIDGPQDDATDFALEWQVRPNEPRLFKDKFREPQFPLKCYAPAKQRGGLGESSFKLEAEEACAHWAHDKDDCIFDVMATRDVLVAEEGHIGASHVM